MGHRFRRGADIDKQRGPVRDLAGYALGNAGLFRRPHHLTILPGGVFRAGRQRGAAVVALNFILFGQLVQIATNGLRADGKMIHQLFCTDISLTTHQLNNGVMTLCLLHKTLLSGRPCGLVH